jgi:hypothetical protein
LRGSHQPRRLNNTYGPPPGGAGPENHGQRRYLDNQRYQQMTQDRMNLPD